MRLFGLLSLLWFNLAVASESLIWLKPNMPPYNIQVGPDSGQGQIDVVEDMLQQAMPEYEHQDRVASYSRILQEIALKSNTCSASLFKDPLREKFIAYSVPYMIVMSNSLVIRADHQDEIKPYLTLNGEVDLTGLLQSGSFVLGTAQGRKYGNIIDNIIRNPQLSDAVYPRVGTDQLQGLLAMSLLDNRQISGFLSNPEQVIYLLKQKKMNEDIFRFYPIMGNSPYVLGYLGCNKNEFGRNVIAKANQLLLQHRANVIAEYNQRWLDEKSIDKYNDWIKQEFGE